MGTQKFLPWVIPEQCEGCTECTSVCPSKCLSMIETSTSGVFIPWINDTDACTGCGKCQNSCVWLAINLTSHIDKAHKRFSLRLV